MNDFFCRVAPHSGLPFTTDTEAGLGQDASPIHLHLPSQVKRSLSTSLSAPELRKQKQQQQQHSSPASTPPSSEAPSPRRMCTAAHRPHCFQHMALSFVAGGLLTYLCICLMCHAGTRLGFLSSPVLPLELPAPPYRGDDQRAALPRSIGLSPMALGNQTQDAHATPDRLIVAARHAEDAEGLEAYLHYKVDEYHHRGLYTLDCQETLAQDTSWLDVYLSDVPHVVYQVGDPGATAGAQHATLANKGNEAMAYLQFILDYWERLPASIVFLHGHRQYGQLELMLLGTRSTWHLLDHVPVLRRLRWGEVPYANLRYRNGPHNNLKWKCRDQTDDERYQKFECDWVGNWIRPGSLRPRKERLITPLNRDEWVDSVELREVWEQTFEEELGPLPSLIHGPCCAEFLVSRDRIRAHPRRFYEGLRDWILETELDRYRSGRVFEYMWPLIFGEPAVTEPAEECNLLHCTHAQRALAPAGPTSRTAEREPEQAQLLRLV